MIPFLVKLVQRHIGGRKTRRPNQAKVNAATTHSAANLLGTLRQHSLPVRRSRKALERYPLLPVGRSIPDIGLSEKSYALRCWRIALRSSVLRINGPQSPNVRRQRPTQQTKRALRGGSQLRVRAALPKNRSPMPRMAATDRSATVARASPCDGTLRTRSPEGE